MTGRWLLWVLAGLNLTCHAATNIVTTTSDSGAGSLRQAILDANSTPGPNTIQFSIGSGPQTINILFSALPTITNSVIIDGTSQPGFAGIPLIRVDGGLNNIAAGLTISAGNSTVRGLVITGFGSGSPGYGIVLSTNGSNIISGNFIGLTTANTARRNSGDGIFINNSAGNTIGGTTAAARNVICANYRNGILISGTNASNNVVLGNYIGLGSAGTNPLPNNVVSGSGGVTISNAPNNTIGGTTAAARNVIEDGYADAVFITGSGATGNVVEGNYIGISAAGAALGSSPSSWAGVRISGAPGNTIGGAVAGAGNVLSGLYWGVLLINTGAVNNLVAGNIIGLNPAGNTAIPNNNGLMIISGPANNVVGGTVPAARNVISGNQVTGVTVQDSSGNSIQGNFIGTDATGMSALPNGGLGSGGGVQIASLSLAVTNNQVGGSTTAAQNVISGNHNDGLQIVGSGASNNVVSGNLIGVAADGLSVLSNDYRGISVLGACSNLIGGPIAGAGNIIANNGLDGIWLAATFGAVGLVGSNNLVMGNTLYSNGLASVSLSTIAAGVTLLGPNVISSNSIYGNVGLGIDRNGDGPTPNVPNGHSNFPILTSAQRGSTHIIGTLLATPNCTYDLEFFANPKGSPTPNQAQSFVGATNVTTGPLGNALINVTFAPTAQEDSSITATATPKCPTNETSELSLYINVSTANPTNNLLTTIGDFKLSGKVGHPVSTFNGELFDLLQPDLDLGGPIPLFFQRYYGAFLKKDGLIAGKLGDNWLHNFEMTLTVTASNTVNIVNALGRFIPFTNSAGSFLLLDRQDIPFQLVTNGSNYILGDPRSQLLYTFDGTGKLTAIADGHGNSHTLTYSGGQLANVSDGLGRVLTFQYSSGGFLTNVSDGTRSVSFVQTGNNLTSASDALGFTTTYIYDPTNAQSALLMAATKPEGNVPFSQVFNTNGQVATQTEAGTNITTLSYSNNTTTITDPIGQVRQDVHTVTGELVAFTDENNQTITNGSNPSGQRSSVTDRNGQTTFIAYHSPSGKPAGITNADGTVTAFTYTGRLASGITFYDLSQIRYPDTTSESYGYDANGNLLAFTDRAGKTWSFGYNAHGELLAATNPTGGVVTYTYNPDGTLASSADSDVGVTTYGYDNLRRLTNVVHPDSTAFRATFDANNRVASVTDERNNISRFNYDQNNRLTQVIDPNGNTNRFVYDSRDRLVQSIDRLGHSSGMTYDTLDNVSSLTDRNGNVTGFNYDPRRRLASITDAGGKNWTFGYDNEARLNSVTNPLAQADSLRMDQLGYPTNFTDSLSHEVNLTLDTMRRVTAVVDPILRTNTFAYDSRGALTGASRQGIGAAAYQRNDLGLLSQITDLNASAWHFAYTDMGRLQSASDPLNRTNSFSYDSLGRLQRIDFADGTIRSNSYDPAGNLIRLRHSDGTDMPFSYDALDRLISANGLALAYDAEGRLTNTTSSGVNFGAAYDAEGRLTNATYNGGTLVVSYSYDSRNRLTQVADNLTGAQITFSYDDAGRLTGATRANGVNGTYTYDAAGRLTRIQEGGIVDIQYTLDAAGQLTQAAFTAPLDPASFTDPILGNFNYDAAHQLNNPGYAYDARGRLRQSPGHGYTYDGVSRLVAIDGVALGYDGLDDVVTRAQAGATNRYFYNLAIGLNPFVAERNEATLQFQRYYVWSPGGRLLYMIDAANGNAVYYFHFDRVGSTLALTAGNGAVTDAYAYSPYGLLLGRTGTSVQPFTFVGEFGVRNEPAAGLYHMRARYYDPITARFLTRDSIWPRLADPQSLDPYEYVAETPLNSIDPVGTDAISDLGIDQLFGWTQPEYKQPESAREKSQELTPLVITKGGTVPGTDAREQVSTPINNNPPLLFPLEQESTQYVPDPLDRYTSLKDIQRLWPKNTGAFVSPSQATYDPTGCRVTQSLERYDYQSIYGVCVVHGPSEGSATGSSIGPPVGILSNEGPGAPFRFQGRRFDNESGLYHFRTRYLDPVEGRFMTRDPIGSWGNSDSLGNPYEHENPANRVDHFGT